jgi:hypothetical protein
MWRAADNAATRLEALSLWQNEMGQFGGQETKCIHLSKLRPHSNNRDSLFAFSF